MNWRITVPAAIIIAAFFLIGTPFLRADSPPAQPWPLFLAGEVPPMVMLVMERDHKLYTEAYDDHSDIDGDGALDVGYKPSIDYYGYFDPYKSYTYDSASQQFVPSGITTDKKCPGMWSGNFLNYITMSRMDCMRKVLFGGYRSTDTATDTVLQRAYIPEDAHSWGKEYESIAVDGYDIRDYTPLALPQSNTRHLFANTSLSDNGIPLMRVMNDSRYRIWEWVSIERPVAGAKCLDGASGPNCATAGGTQWLITPAGFFQGLTQTTYNTTGYSGSPATHAAYETLVTTYATAAKKFGSAPVATINGSGNPFSSQQDHYLAIFSGQIAVPANDTYNFAVDGDDAVELIIDGTVVVGWYGGHGKCSCQTHTGSITLSAGTHTIVFRRQENTGDDNYYLYYSQNIPASSITDYTVRVKVALTSMPESNCKKYPSGVYKPVGLLQRYGESNRMYFGLITGSYAKNESGGVLRKNIGTITNEIVTNTGQFTSVNGIISTINKLRIVGFDYGSYYYNQNCGWITTRPMNEGECRMWGNPIGEMMYETLRYFAGKASPTAGFTYSGTTDDSSLGLPLATWKDPYNSTDGSPYCAKPFMLVLSDVEPNYDSDKIPGSYFNVFTGDVSGLDVANLADIIGTEEDAAGNHYIGQSGTNYDGACTPKNVANLGSIRGSCPNEPTKQESYYSASVAYFSRINDVHPTAKGAQKIDSFVVALSSPLPKIEINVNGKLVTLMPFGKSVGGCLGIDGTQGLFQPTNDIVDFYVEQILPNYGRFRVNFEDVEQGSDYDMDAIVHYEYQVTGDTVTVTLTSEYAAGCIMQHMGYIISGTTADGTYLVVRDVDTAAGTDPNYYLDTPQHPGADLPLSDSRSFTVGSTGAATVLENPLWYAAKWGGFNDMNNNNKPDDPKEWDVDNDGVPDNYFFVQNPLRLDEQLNKAFSAILRKAASGSAVSVLATKGEGEGTLVQAYFKPNAMDETGQHDITWTGYLQCLWVDQYGNIREDSVHDYTLNPLDDRIIEYYQDTDTGDTRIKRYAVDNTNPYNKTGTPEYIPLENIQPLWEAGRKLWSRASDARQIYTYTDTLIDFTTANASILKPYLNVLSDGDNSTLGATQNDRVSNLIQFIRGTGDHASAYTGSPTLRSRDFTIQGETNPWRLGDIVNSTPMSIARPFEQYAALYDDSSYKQFIDTYRTRETVIYVGANDGMIHAFSAGQYDDTAKKFNQGATVGIGDELWAYIPQSLLPHLKWLASPNYSHLSYVDLKPKVLEAKIFTSDTTHPNGWGTVLICGMNMGGKAVSVIDPAFSGGAKSFSSSYVALDVTDSAQPPAFLWEKTFDGLGFTTNQPCLVKVKDKWLLAFGNGPTDYDGSSSNPGRVFIVDLKTGDLVRTFPSGTETSDNNAVMNSPVSLDKNMNYSVAGIYSSESFYNVATSNWMGKVYKITIPQITSGDYDPASYDDNPDNWKWGTILNLQGLPHSAPISSPLTLSVDANDNVWFFMGTGRFETPADKIDGSQNYIFGIKDPFYNRRGKDINSSTLPSCLHSYTAAGCTLTLSDLFDASPYTVKADGTIDAEASDPLKGKKFDDFLKQGVQKQDTQGQEIYQGWYRKLTVITGSPSERVINKAAAFGGIVLFPAFTPSTDQCLSGGESSLYAMYFESGTAYKKTVLKNADNSSTIQYKIDLGAGLASSTAIHAGKEEGQSGKVISQLSTGQIVQVDVIPAVSVKNGLQYWRQGK